MAKFAVILQASPGDLGRAVHGLLYAKDLKEAGHEVQLLYSQGRSCFNSDTPALRPH